MKILYIYQYFTTRDGSGSIRCFEFSKQWIKRGHEVTVLTAANDELNNRTPMKSNKLSKEYEIDGIKIISVDTKYSNYMSNFRRIWAFISFMLKSSIEGLIRANDYDIVFATSTPLTVAVPALIIKKFKKIPYVFEVRDLWPEAPIQIGAIKSPTVIKLLKKFERKVYREAKHIIALSPGMEQGILNEGISKEKVTMVPNCSDLDLFNNIHGTDVDEVKEKYNLHNKFIIAHTGAMGVSNGLDYIVNAAKVLKNRKVDDIVFLFVGDGKQKPFLEEECKKSNLSNIIFVGKVSKKEVPLYLSLSNITITSFKNLPILATNSPNKFFDSLAAGKPVIVNSNGWTKDLVEKNEVGFYVNPEKPEDLADLLCFIKSQPDKLEIMGKKARELAEREFDRVKLARKVEATLVNSIEN